MVALELPLKVDVKQVHLTDEQFYQLCINNPDLTIERSKEGVLIFMPPVGGDSGSWEADYITDLNIWNRATKKGKVFSSSTLFRLPGGGDPCGICEAARSPDAAWVELSRWLDLTPEQRAKFPLIAPDFMIELRSRTDDLLTLQEKMQEYLDSGVRLGWMFNPQDQQVEIYRQGQLKEVRSLPTQLSGESVLPGFVLNADQF